MTEIMIEAKDGGRFSAYLALPVSLPAPVIIVIQEIFGVNREMREKCDELARQGYIAVSPDLFWRLKPGVQLTDKSEAEWQEAFSYFKAFDVDKGVEDIGATYDHFKNFDGSTGKIGAVGYCLGGKLAYLTAAHIPVDAAVSYYGVGLDELLGEAPAITNPLLLHIAEGDEYFSPQAQKKIADGLKDHKKVTIYSYPGVNHAFARGNGINYDENAATKANKHTAELFAETLF